MSAEPSPKRIKVGEGEAGMGVDAVDETVPAEDVAPDWAPEAEDRLAADLEDCQKALDRVNDEASDRVLAVEQEYNKKRRPIYTQRAEIIRKVPLFWQRTLLSHPALADQLTDDDTVVLEYMTELDVLDFDDIKSGFKVVLSFAPGNPYFSNPQLVKAFHYGDDGGVTIEPASIDWKEGYAPYLTNGPGYFFFDWMTLAEPLGEGGTPDVIAEVLKDEIWPNPVKYFLSEDVEADPAAAYEPDLEDGLLEEDEFEGVGLGGEDPEGEEGLVADVLDLDAEEAEAVYDEGEADLGGDEGDLVDEGEEGAGGDDEGFADDGGGDGEGEV